VLTTAIAVWSEPTQASTTGSAGSGATATSTATGHQVNFGIAYGDTLLGAPTAQLDAALDDAVKLGVKWVRVDLPWTTVEPYDTGNYNWLNFDAVVSAVRARNLKLDPILDEPPQWARETSCQTDYNCPPADDSQFADFAAAAARRYAPQGVETWEIWNEPNMNAWYPTPDPAAYTKLLIATSKAIRAVDPNAFLILGGLGAVATDPSMHWISAYDFITAVGKLGGTRYVNAVGYHPYSLPVMPSAATNFANISSTPYNLVSALALAGTPNVSIWITESGADVAVEGGDPEAKKPASQQAEQVQAAYGTDLIQTVAANTGR
jgi:hypothetical protein